MKKQLLLLLLIDLDNPPTTLVEPISNTSSTEEPPLPPNALFKPLITFGHPPDGRSSGSSPRKYRSTLGEKSFSPPIA